MRGIKAKRLRTAARQAARLMKSKLVRVGEGTVRWIGYRRIYQDSKRRAA
jgi:hypothetical protein